MLAKSPMGNFGRIAGKDKSKGAVVTYLCALRLFGGSSPTKGGKRAGNTSVRSGVYHGKLSLNFEDVGAILRVMRRPTIGMPAALLAIAMLALFGFSTADAAETSPDAAPIELTSAQDGPEQDSEPTSPAGRSSPLAAPITITTTEEISGVDAITIGAALNVSAAITATDLISGAADLTGTDELTATAPITIDATVTDTQPVTSTDALTDSIDLDEQYDEVVEGTIVANRTDANVRFFLEGDTFLIDPRARHRPGITQGDGGA